MEQRYARIGGLLYLIVIVAGIFAEFSVRSTLIVSCNARAESVSVRHDD
jgi:hypothetical protein